MTDQASHETSPAIAMRDIGKRFGAVVANEGVDFEARFGEVHALIGENGAGKSTLMSIVAGLYRPDSGDLFIAGDNVEFASPGEAIDRGIGMLYQHFMLVDPFTVAENVVLGEPGGIRLELAEVRQRIRELVDEHQLEVDPDAHIWQLSVGEEQRVEILRLLYRGARILVLDEPTAVLTPQEAASLIRTLRRLAAAGYCIVFISHKLDEVLAVADRVTVLRKGRTIATVDAADADRASLARLMVGRELVEHLEQLDAEHERIVPTGQLVLEAHDIHVTGDRGSTAVNGLSLGVRSGEVLGIAGVAGNGQRELAEALTGLRPIKSGEVFIEGTDFTKAGAGDIADAGVAHVPEDRLQDGLIAAMSLSDNAILRDYQKQPLSRGPVLLRKAIDSFSRRVLHEFAVSPAHTGTRVGALSGGNQQKLLIGRELTGEPIAMVAVHPTRGVDVGASEAIHDMVRAQRARGAAILLISEDLDELMALSDRIAVIYRGKLIGEVPADRIFRDQIGLWMAGLDTGDSASA